MFWALIGLALLVAGLMRDEALLRYGGLDAVRPQPGEDLPLRPERAQLGRPGALVHRGRRPRPRGRLLPPAAELADATAPAPDPVETLGISPGAIPPPRQGRPPAARRATSPGASSPGRASRGSRAGRSGSARRAPSGARSAGSSAGRRVTRTRTTSCASAYSPSSGSSSSIDAIPFTRSRFGLAKSMNRSPTCGLRSRFPMRQVHAVAVVARERERPLVDDADEPGIAALVGALRHAVLVGRREEEHVARLDERAVVGVEPVAIEPLLDPVGEPAGVEPVLQATVPVVVEVGH